MQVIGHDDIAANCDIEFGGATGKLNEREMCSLRCENLSASMSAKCDKVDRWIETLKDFIQSRRTTTKFSEGHNFRLAERCESLQSRIRTAHSAVATASCASY